MQQISPSAHVDLVRTGRLHNEVFESLSPGIM